MKRLLHILAALIAMLQMSLAAPLPISMTQVFNNFGVIAGEEVTYSSESEWRVAAGTIVLPRTNQIGKNVTLDKASPILITGGITGNGNTLHVDKGSVVSATTPNNTALNFNSGGSLSTGATAFSNALETFTGNTSMSSLMGKMQSYSLQLDSEPVTGTMSLSDPNSFTFNGVAGSPYTYIDITAAKLAEARGIRVNTNGSFVVINVTGSGTFGANSLSNTGGILWNLNGDATFTGGRWYGDVLSPTGTINLQHGITGTVVGNKVILGDEGHKDAEYTMPDVANVPEVGTSSLLIVAIGLLTLRRRR